MLIIFAALIGRVTPTQVSIQNPTISLPTGEVGELILSIRSASSFDSIQLESIEPKFNFSNSWISSLGHEITAQSSDALSISSSVENADVQYFRIARVTYASTAGDTTWRVSLFNGSSLLERVTFSGWKLPGRINVSSLSLSSLFTDPQADSVTLAVVSSLPVRLGDSATLRITLMLGARSSSGSLMRLLAPGFTFFSPVSILERSTNRQNTLTSSNFGTGYLEIVLQDETQPGTFVISVTVAAPFEQLSTDEWFFSMTGSDQILTNLGTFSPPTLSDRIDFTITSSRASPNATIFATLSTRHQGTFSLIGPLGFSFPSNCGTACSCSSLDSTTAFITVIESGFSSCSLLVNTPSSMSDEHTNWIAYSGQRSSPSAWGVDSAGFGLSQMPSARVLFPGSPSNNVWAILEMFTGVRLDPGSRIRLIERTGTYNMDCRASNFNPVSLPVTAESCTSISASELSISVDLNMLPGLFSFAFKIVLPSKGLALFDLYLLDPRGSVVDARMGIQGPELLNGLSAKALEVTTNATDPGVPARTTFGIQTLAMVPRNFRVGRILVKSAGGFEIRDSNNVHVSGLSLRGPIIQIDSETVALDLEPTVPLIPQVVTISLAVRTPLYVSDSNFWQIFFCQDKNSSAVLAVFVSPGFDLGATPTQGTSLGCSGRLGLIWLVFSCVISFIILIK